MSEKLSPSLNSSFPVGLTFPKSPFPDGLISVSPWEFCSFEPLAYILFNIAFVIIPYPLYRIIAGLFKWELNAKTPSKHFNDMIALVRYGFIVFVLGGYAKTFNWIVILSFYIAMFVFALLAELPFAKQSLVTISNWSIKMWILFIVAACIVLAFAGIHIYFGVVLMNENKFREKNDVFIAWYLGGLLVPLILMALAYIANQEQNTRFLTKFYLKFLSIFKKKTIEQPSITNTADQTDQMPITTETTPDEQKKSVIHLHHWQIFYTLAFFTRFEHPVSRVAGGITLGIYTQGMIAYGPDSFLEG